MGNGDDLTWSLSSDEPGVRIKMPTFNLARVRVCLWMLEPYSVHLTRHVLVCSVPPYLRPISRLPRISKRHSLRTPAHADLSRPNQSK